MGSDAVERTMSRRPRLFAYRWLRGLDLNQRPLGYEPERNGLTRRETTDTST